MGWIVSSALLSVLLFSGCSGNRERKPVVGVVPKGANHIFWQTVHAGANKAAEEYGLEVEWNAPTLEIDASRQIAIIDSMINRRLAGIALAPVDRTALVNVVERAGTQQVPVAIFDSGIDTTKRVTYVATDNREGGRLAARELGRLLSGEGKLAVIGFMAGSASTMEREEGFAEEIRTNFPKMKIVQTVFGMADRAKALAGTENVLNAHPDLAGIFADNESSSAGAMMAIKARNATKVRTIAFDSNEQLVSDLKDKRLDALVLQDPFKMGYEAVKALGMKLKGQTPPALIDSGVYLVTRETMEQPDVVTLLRPDLQKWLGGQRSGEAAH
ncbi:MAG: substrate-binding domain-containing protein [Bryobacteraceae bacterium]|nr:substrate-binding domain-containing protein [Bryobacteraceae bacterium]